MSLGLDLTTTRYSFTIDFQLFSVSCSQGLFDRICLEFETQNAPQSYMSLLQFGSLFRSFSTRGPFGAPLARIGTLWAFFWTRLAFFYMFFSTLLGPFGRVWRKSHGLASILPRHKQSLSALLCVVWLLFRTVCSKKLCGLNV